MIARLAAVLALAGCGGAPVRVEEPEPEVAGREGDDATAPPAAAGGAATLLDEAWRELGLVRETRYSHRTHVDEAAGRFELDCSGFVDYALGRSIPDALAELRAATVPRPLAKHYVQFFAGLARGAPSKRWSSILRATDLVPGDVIAWLRPADSTSRNTGHVMIVRAPIHRDPSRDDAIAVPIIDSTALTHGRDDSRRASRTTGLGVGEVLLLIDAAGTPIGFRWSRGTRAHDHHTSIAMARIH